MEKALFSFFTICTFGTLVHARSSAAASSSCPAPTLYPSYAAPTVDGGWSSQLLVSGLTKPRSIVLDSSGSLLVLERGAGIRRVHLTRDGDSCVVAGASTLIVNMTSLNHGLAISPDGETIYASSADHVFSWPYNNSTGSVTANATTVVSGLGVGGGDQVTRTILASQLVPGTIIVSKGSGGSVDQARNVSSGLGQVKAFNLGSLTSTSEPYDFSTSGQLLGWGLYNAVGLAEHPETGGIFSMDNGQDDLTRNGVDIHQTNPGDEMNYHGILSSIDDEDRGGNYGYPYCNAAWDTDIPDAPEGLVVGKQFSMFNNSTSNDSSCDNDFTRPRQTFQPHQAPLGMVFSPDGATAYVSFHGSTAETDKVGYLVGSVTFSASRGQPNRAYDSYIALDDIIRNSNDTTCPASCMRPVGLAMLDDRLLFSSDATGEIYLLVKSTVGADAGYDKTLRVAIGVSVGLVVVLFILGVCIYWRWKRNRLLLGAHSSGAREPTSVTFAAAHPSSDNDDGIQLTSRKSWRSRRSRSVKNACQQDLQGQASADHDHRERKAERDTGLHL